MSNCANVTFKKPITVPEYYALAQEAVNATYGDALSLDYDPLNTDINQSGIGVTTDTGHYLFQLFLDEPTRIMVDHRRGEVGYMVSDVLMRYLARKLDGAVWTEDCLEEPLDKTQERPLYLVDYYRRTHARIIEKDGWDLMKPWLDAIRELYFSEGKFARFWEKE